MMSNDQPYRMKNLVTPLLLVVMTLICLCGCGVPKNNIQKIKQSNSAGSPAWQKTEIKLSADDLMNTQQKLPTDYEVYIVNKEELTNFFNAFKLGNKTPLSIPILGKTYDFTLTEANTISPELAKKYPDLYSLKGNADNATARVNYDGDKLRAEITAKGINYILEPYETKANQRYYLIYNQSNTGYEKVPFE